MITSNLEKFVFLLTCIRQFGGQFYVDLLLEASLDLSKTVDVVCRNDQALVVTANEQP